MGWICRLACVPAALLMSTVVAAQDIPVDPAEATGPPPANYASGLQAESLPGELSEDIDGALPGTPLGPTPVADVRFLMDNLGFKNLVGESRIRTFGWFEGGYTGASSGTGMLSVQPRQNRFGNEFLVNQIGFVIQKPLKQDQFDIGFNVRYFAGGDAALGQPKGGIGDPVSNQHFAQDFRDLYISAHLPILTEGGVDVKAGRMNSIIGYNGFLAPYRPFYSSDYQFFYSQDGAFTGVLTNLHATDRLEIWNGVTFGANTFFTKRSSNSICYIGQVNYWLTDEHRTRLTASVYTGPDAIFAAPGMNGDFNTTVELRLQHNWTERLFQVVQSNMGWDANTPVGTGSWYGLYTIGIYNLTDTISTQARAEWFDDVQGTRTGVGTNYSEVTLGLNWHPSKFFELRPEIRGDFAGAPAYGVGGEHTHYSQLTGGISALVKF
ncbi:outer membrane beta-barrel protein [Isosphaeraceae bacterium EP7]